MPLDSAIRNERRCLKEGMDADFVDPAEYASCNTENIEIAFPSGFIVLLYGKYHNVLELQCSLLC